jgi:dTDP-4-dehydrorhamnose 3,5-epimerase
VESKRLAIADVVVFTAHRHTDERGFFAEIFRQDAFDAVAGPTVFVQDNHSLSRAAGVVRGLHFQAPLHAQGKLVQVVRGAILDAAVDIRVGSPSFGKHVTAILSADNCRQLWVPVGFAHGYCTLEPDTEVIYKVTDYYSRPDDRGLAFDDPALAIAWPVAAEEAIVSDRDRRHPRLAGLPRYFQWTGSGEFDGARGA